jgi:hypothetical protein
MVKKTMNRTKMTKTDVLSSFLTIYGKNKPQQMDVSKLAP